MKKIITLSILLLSNLSFAQDTTLTYPSLKNSRLTVQLPVAEGLYPNFDKDRARYIINQTGDALLLKTNEYETVIEINNYGSKLGKLTNGAILYDGRKDCVNEFNAVQNAGNSHWLNCSIQRTINYMPVRGFDAFTNNGTEIRDDDPETMIEAIGEPKIFLNGVMLARNYETNSMDSPEGGVGHSFEWDGFSITIVPYSHFMKLLSEARAELEPKYKLKQPKFKYPDNWQTLLSSNLIYSYDPAVDAQRNVVKTIIREKIQRPGETPVYPFAIVKGPFWNDKTWPFFSNTCEFYDCDTVGAQAISFAGSGALYPIVNYKDLRQFKDDLFVVSVQAGDGGAEDDDLMGFFMIDRYTLETNNRIIYRQKNTRGGIDFMIELQLKDLRWYATGE